MNFDRDYRFFLKVALVFLIASMLLPFAFQTFIHGHYVNPSIGVRVSRHWHFSWSFMHVSVSAPADPDQPIEGLLGTFWLVPPNYWVYEFSSSSSNPMVSMFVLQIVLLLFGFTIVKKAGSMWSLMLLLIGIVTLGPRYWQLATTYFGALSFGFWVLVVATLFISIALVRVKNWM